MANQDGLRVKRECLGTGQCDESLHRVRAHIAVGDKSVEIREGLVVNVNSTYWLLLTQKGVVVAPKDGVKLIEPASN